MKFIHYIERVGGVSVYGIFSLALFGLIFGVMLVWALRADRNMIKEISQIPLDDQTN
jgi:cytochrome c oxidase cbb3-type subunit 4